MEFAMPSVGYWDLALIVVIALMATLASYVRAPRLKALIITFPIPFTIASLALGQPVGVSHAMSLVVLLFYTHLVRWLHVGGGMPIVPSIVLSAVVYVLVGGTLAKLVPNRPATFWTAAAVTFLVGVGLHCSVPHKVEPGHRSPLPVAFKFILVVLVMTVVVVIKSHLQGFMTFFPMVGVVVAYEARKSLWTIGRQIPVLMIVMVPVLVTIYLAQQHFSLGMSLLLGWVVFPFLLVPLTVRMWRRQAREEQHGSRSA